MDNTPIYDIKPYLPYTDCKTDAVGGFVDTLDLKPLNVEIPKELLQKIPADKQTELIKVLQNNPKPSYQNDPERIYGFYFDNLEISFKSDQDTLTVVAVE